MHSATRLVCLKPPVFVQSTCLCTLDEYVVNDTSRARAFLQGTRALASVAFLLFFIVRLLGNGRTTAGKPSC